MELLFGRVTDYGVSGLWFNPWAGFLLLEQKPVLYYEWSVTGETHALYHNVGEKKVSYGGVFALAVEQPQPFRKLH